MKRSFVLIALLTASFLLVLACGNDDDSDSDGVPDDCDIAAATSLDCDNNGIPDECDMVYGTDGCPFPDGVLDNSTGAEGWRGSVLSIVGYDPDNALACLAHGLLYFQQQPVGITPDR